MRLMFPSGYEAINGAFTAGSQTIVRHVVYQSLSFHCCGMIALTREPGCWTIFA